MARFKNLELIVFVAFRRLNWYSWTAMGKSLRVQFSNDILNRIAKFRYKIELQSFPCN